MNILIVLVPCSLILGLGALIGFVWTLRSNQYEDMDGDAARVLLEDEEYERSHPLTHVHSSKKRQSHDGLATLIRPKAPHD